MPSPTPAHTAQITLLELRLINEAAVWPVNGAFVAICYLTALLHLRNTSPSL